MRLSHSILHHDIRLQAGQRISRDQRRIGSHTDGTSRPARRTSDTRLLARQVRHSTTTPPGAATGAGGAGDENSARLPASAATGSGRSAPFAGLKNARRP